MLSKLKKQLITHFKKKLVQFEYPVIPASQVPLHIIKPQYVLNKQNPQFTKEGQHALIWNIQQIKKIKQSGMIAGQTLRATQQFLIQKGKLDIKNGTNGTITAQDIDKFVFNYIIQKGAYPSPIGFLNFPKSVCVSINECILHGIPNTRPIYLGDKVNLDVCIYYDGFHGDTNLTVIYGGLDQAPTPQVRNIVSLCQKGLYRAIGICKPGVLFNQIGKLLEKYGFENNIQVCPYFNGHGIGNLLHMPPHIFHTTKHSYQQCGYKPDVMRSGNVFTIEPVMTCYDTSRNCYHWSDQMTIISENNPNAQFQHTILITDKGCQVLTQREGQNIPNINGNIQNLKIY